MSNLEYARYDTDLESISFQGTVPGSYTFCIQPNFTACKGDLSQFFTISTKKMCFARRHYRELSNVQLRAKHILSAKIALIGCGDI